MDERSTRSRERLLPWLPPPPPQPPAPKPRRSRVRWLLAALAAPACLIAAFASIATDRLGLLVLAWAFGALSIGALATGFVHAGSNAARIATAGPALVLAVVLASSTVVAVSGCPADPGPDADLAGCDYAGADLAGADLRRSNLAGANLSETDLSGAKLDGARLQGANLSGAVLREASLEGADLASADLGEAILADANLHGADLRGAALVGADLRAASLLEADLVEVDLSGASLEGASLSGADLTAATLAGAVVSGASLSRATLVGSDLAGLDLRTTSLSDADLAGAVLDGANLEAATPGATAMAGVSARELGAARADLSGVDLSGAALDGARLHAATLSEANLSDASLPGADLSGADLSGSDLSGADLSGANLVGVDADRADLRGAVLEGVALGENSFVRTQGIDDALLMAALAVGPVELGEALTEGAIRLEERSAIMQTLGAVCRGGGVAAAASYPQGGFHPLVILDARGHPTADSTAAERMGWAPMAMRFAQLVVCVEPEQTDTVQSCPYSLEGGGGMATVIRERYSRRVRVLEARTGDVVLDRTFEGNYPKACPPVTTFFGGTVKTMGGSHVNLAAYRAELSRLVR